MSANNLTALEEKNAADGYGIGDATDGYEAPDYMHADTPAAPASRTPVEDTVGGTSGLDLLRTRTRSRVSRNVVIEVPDRDGIGLEMEAYIEAREMRDWTKHSRLDKRKPASDDNVDGVLLAARAVATKTRGIVIDGQRLIDSDSGDSLTFLDGPIQRTYEARAPWDAAKALVGTDPGILAMFQTLMEESGYANSAEVTSGN